jgi:hypothetical protein
MVASLGVGREKTVDLGANCTPEVEVESLGGTLASIESSRIFAKVLDSGLPRIKTIGAKHSLAVVNDVGQLQDGEWIFHGVSCGFLIVVVGFIVKISGLGGQARHVSRYRKGA